ncbi:Uncharacterised protein [Salmonella enterica subsp. enterica]|nr:Uncharacterised protein [Salmonella enterica subsp. enterica]
MRSNQLLYFPGQRHASGLGVFILPGVNGELLQNQQHDELQRRAALVLFLLVHKLAKKRNQRLRIGNLGYAAARKDASASAGCCPAL